MESYIKPVMKRFEDVSDILVGDSKLNEESHLVSKLNRPHPYVYCPFMLTGNTKKY